MLVTISSPCLGSQSCEPPCRPAPPANTGALRHVPRADRGLCPLLDRNPIHLKMAYGVIATHLREVTSTPSGYDRGSEFAGCTDRARRALGTATLTPKTNAVPHPRQPLRPARFAAASFPWSIQVICRLRRFRPVRGQPVGYSNHGSHTCLQDMPKSHPECAVRMRKVKQKVSGFLGKAAFARTDRRISSDP